MEKKATYISTDDDTDVLINKLPSDGSKRKKQNNKQNDFLYGSGKLIFKIILQLYKTCF